MPGTRALAALVGCALATIACDSSRSEASVSKPAEATVTRELLPSPDAPPPPQPAPTTQPSYEEAEFKVALVGPASAKAGETLAFAVTLLALDGYKVNQEYPIKFQVHKAEGVLPEKETIQKDDAKFEGHGVTLPVKVKVQSPGRHQVAGRLSFSVCKTGDASVCLLEKKELGVTLDAS